MSDRKYKLEDMRKVREGVLKGDNFLQVGNYDRGNYSDAIRAYFVAFGEVVKIVEFDKDQLYIRMER